MAEILLFEQLQNEEWFQLSATRDEAERYLKNKPNGSFVVRNSSKPDHFALSYKNFDNKITHSLIQKTATGYKIPGEEREPEYPTLKGLLATCKFLKYNGNEPKTQTQPSSSNKKPIPDSMIATLVEAFPDLPLETIVDALQKNNVDLNLTIDYLLNNPSDNTATVTEVKSLNSHGYAQLLANIFSQISKGKGSPNIVVRWSTLQPGIANAVGTNEANLNKILQNPSHSVGKKISAFVTTFNKGYHGYYSSVELTKKFNAALNDIKDFMTQTQIKIKQKVPDFSKEGPIIWRAVEVSTIPGIYSSLIQLFQSKYSERNIQKSNLLQKWTNITIQETTVPAQYHLNGKDSYSRAINSLKAISFRKTIYEKIQCLQSTMTAILEVTAGHLANKFIPLEDFICIFTFVLVKAQVPYVASELMILKEFIDETLTTSQEGFLLALFEVSLENLQTIKKSENPMAEVKVQKPAEPSNVVPLLPPPSPKVNKTSPTLREPVRPAQMDQPQPGTFYEYALPSAPLGTIPRDTVLYPQMAPVHFANEQQFHTYGYPSNPVYPQQFPQQHFVYPQNVNPIPAPYPSNAHQEDERPPSYSVATIQLQATAHANRPSYGVIPFHGNTDESVPLPELPKNGPQRFDTLFKAEESFVNNLINSPPTVDSCIYLANYYANQGNYDKAIQQCSLVLTMDPTNQSAMKLLETYARQRQSLVK